VAVGGGGGGLPPCLPYVPALTCAEPNLERLCEISAVRRRPWPGLERRKLPCHQIAFAFVTCPRST